MGLLEKTKYQPFKLFFKILKIFRVLAHYTVYFKKENLEISRLCHYNILEPGGALYGI